MKFQVIGRQNEESQYTVNEILKILDSLNLQIDNILPDIIIFVGGDGTFLRAVHANMHRINEVGFVGVNHGSLGFFCDYDKNEIEDLINDIIQERCIKKYHDILNISLYNEKSIKELHAVNEVRIENPFHTLVCDVIINDEYLESFRGNGLVVASAAGSSAYNRSLGGALIECGTNLLELTEIAPIQNVAYNSLGSSLVINGKNVIRLTGDFSSIVVGYDHLIYDTKEIINKVEITSSNLKVCLLRKKQYNYFNKIKKSFIKR